MSIEALLKVLPAPSHPLQTFSGPWEPIEALPPDYKQFVEIYGFGYFMEYLGIAVPRSRNENTCLEFGVVSFSDLWKSYFQDGDEPYQLWPEPEGLIWFGSTDNGEDLLWLPRGSPETWPIVVRGHHNYEILDCDLTTFLAGLITGDIVPDAFPDDLLPCELPFEPTGA
jgi:hypothetical protein